MATLEWDDSLLTGDREIDIHHKAFISQADRLERACRRGRGVAEVEKMIGFLEDYGRHHFRAEEDRMQRLNYPYVETHRAQHGQYLEEVAKLRAVLKKSGATPELAKQIRDLVVDWLFRHIRGTDMPMIEFLREHTRVKPPSAERKIA